MTAAVCGRPLLSPGARGAPRSAFGMLRARLPLPGARPGAAWAAWRTCCWQPAAAMRRRLCRPPQIKPNTTGRRPPLWLLATGVHTMSARPSLIETHVWMGGGRLGHVPRGLCAARLPPITAPRSSWPRPTRGWVWPLLDWPGTNGTAPLIAHVAPAPATQPPRRPQPLRTARTALAPVAKRLWRNARS